MLDYKANLTIVFFIVFFLFVIVIDKENELISNDHLLIKSVFAIPPDQDLIVLSSWKINTTNIKDIALDFTGNIYFTEYASNKIGRLIPSTNTITEWNIPTENSGPTDLVSDGSSSSIYFIEDKTNKIGKVDFTSSKFSEYQLNSNSTITGGFIDITYDGNLKQLYYVLNDTLTIGRLDTSTNTTTEWNIPSQNSNSTTPKEITSLTSVYGDIFFVKSDSNKIGRLTPSTNTITEWNVPTENSGPTDLVFDFGTSVYFLENKTGKIGRYNFIQNVFTEWDISKSPYLVAANSVGDIFFVDKEKIARIS
ncbi:MAG TPA: hypothetical protein VFK40_13980 [Nitrososphaeraceae archaeon]|nr:hypothetical protein [Nitrososphaeraceae archaeon]